jgi:tetratricopeptide (TPR) repeat protein
MNLKRFFFLGLLIFAYGANAIIVVDSINKEGNQVRTYFHNNKKKFKIEIIFSKGPLKKMVSLYNKQEKRISIEKFFSQGSKEKIFFSKDGKTIIKKSYDRNGNGIYDHFIIFKKGKVKKRFSLNDSLLAQAQATFKKAVKKDATTWDYYKKARRQFDQVITNYKKEFANYLRSNVTLPQDVKERLAEAHLGRGHCFFYQNQIKKAQEAYNQALELSNNPVNQSHAARSIGVCFIAQKKYRPAMKYFQKSLDFRIDDLETRNYIAALYKFSEDYNLAIQILEDSLKAISLEKDLLDKNFRAKTEYNLACFYSLAGKKEKALAYLQKAADHGYAKPHKIKKEKDLASIQKSPRFQKIYQQIKENAQPAPKEGQALKKTQTVK